LMSLVVKMLKVNQSLLGESTTVPTKDGRLSTLTNLKKLKMMVLIKTSDGTETDHSTLDPDSQ
jgi:hypothetical protein